MGHPKISAMYLGFIETNPLTNSQTSSRSIEEKMIELLENAQLIGTVPKSTDDPENEISIDMSKFGLKMMYRSTEEVKMRIPLLQLVLFTTYNDGYGKINAVITENVENSVQRRQKCHLIQFRSETNANLLCKLVNESFLEAEEARMLMDVTEPPSPLLADV